MAEKYKNAVGVVVLVGNDGPVPYATAWSISPSWFATNSHVTELVKKAQKHGVDVFIAINRSPDKRWVNTLLMDMGLNPDTDTKVTIRGTAFDIDNIVGSPDNRRPSKPGRFN